MSKKNFDTIFSEPVKLILGKKRRKMSDSTYKRLRFVCFAYLTGLLYTSGILVSDLGQTSQLAVGIDLFMIISILLLAVLVHWTHYYRLAFHASVAILAITVLVGYFAPTGNRTAFLTPLILILSY